MRKTGISEKANARITQITEELKKAISDAIARRDGCQVCVEINLTQGGIGQSFINLRKAV